MKTITVNKLYDKYDCEDCGTTYTQGASVEIDGVEVLRLEPIAHCYDIVDYQDDEIFKRVIQHLGYNISIDDRW